MSDALPRNITLIGRLEKEHAADSPRRLLEILHESITKKPPLPEASSSIGAAYRIRTYDVLIRSQTLYPAEVTPQLVDYYAQGLNNGQVFFQKKFLKLIFTHLATWRDLRCIVI